jgi:hypothetical protein
MYELIRRLTVRQLTVEQLPILLVSFGIAEVFYKFHSFMLETGAFLVTWYALDAGYAAVRGMFGKDEERKS